MAKPRGPLEKESVPRKPLEEDPVLRATGRLQKSIWTPGRHQAGKDLSTAWEAPGRHQRAGKDHLDSPRGTREAPGRQERTIWDSLGGTREVPGRQERTIWDSLGGTREAGEPIGQPARHEGGTREAGKDHLDSLGGTRAC